MPPVAALLEMAHWCVNFRSNRQNLIFTVETKSETGERINKLLCPVGLILMSVQDETNRELVDRSADGSSACPPWRQANTRTSRLTSRPRSASPRFASECLAKLRSF